MTTEARLVRSVILTSANNGLRVNGVTYTIAAGTYYHADDGAADDFVEEIEGILQTALGTSNITARLVGVGAAADAARASGRWKVVHTSGASVTIDWDHAGTTIDSALLGYDTTVTGTQAYTAGVTTYSPYVHRAGWYPQTDAEEDPLTRTTRTHVEYTSGGYRDGINWGEDKTIHLAFDQRSAALVEIDQGLVAARAADVLTTVGDPHIAFERWALDCAANPATNWRYYPSASDTTTYKGPFAFGPGSALWTAPLGPPTGITHRAGRYWSVVIDGQEAR